MLLIVSLVFLSFRQSLCVLRTCTREERCLHVDASVCDKSKCLLLNKTDVDWTVSTVGKLYAWNIGRNPYMGFCPISFTFEQPQNYDGTPTLNATVTLYSGKCCNESTTLTKAYYPDLDPRTGQVHILTAEYDGDTYYECYQYLDPGKAYVYVSCLDDVDGYSPPGQACAAIFARISQTEKCTDDKLADYVANINADFLQLSPNCL